MSSFDLSEQPITVGPVVVKPRDPSLPEQRCVAVLNTGGTIGMKANASGSLEPSPGYLAERICSMSEFKRGDTPAVDLYELLPLLDSSDMGPADWIRIAQMIESLFYSYDGFVVVMGTDTMAYCGSALSFLLENLNKPVILTGAMLPLVDLFNDAHRNLIVSVVLASILDVPEVCIFINDKLMRGNRTVKVSSSGLDAFDSPNFPPLALLETGIRFRPHLCLPQPRGRFRVNKALSTAVAVWRMVPGFDDHYIRVSIRDTLTLRAIVLELYGTGNLSARKSTLIDALSEAIEKGIIIVATSQCLRGTVNLSAYTLGKKLEAIGVVQAGDMTTEAVCAKLAYLMAIPGITREQVILHMGRNLRGEITESKPVMALGSRGLVMGASSGTLSTLAHGASTHPHTHPGALTSPVSVPSGHAHPHAHAHQQAHQHPSNGSFSPAASVTSAPARLAAATALPTSPDPYYSSATRPDPESAEFYSSTSIVTGRPIPIVPAGSVGAAEQHQSAPSPAPTESSVASSSSSLSSAAPVFSFNHPLAHGGLGAGAVPIKITGDAASGVGQGEVVIRMRTLEDNSSAVALGFGSRPEFSPNDFLPAAAAQPVAHSARLTVAPASSPAGVVPVVSSGNGGGGGGMPASVASLLPPQHFSPRAGDGSSGGSGASAAAALASLPKAGDANRAGRASINHLQALLNSAATISSLNAGSSPQMAAKATASGSPRMPPPPPPQQQHTAASQN